MTHPLKPRRAQVFGRDVQFSKLSAAKVRPEYRPVFREEYHSREAACYAAEHYRETGKILLHGEVKAVLKKQRRAMTKERKHEYKPIRHVPQQEEMRI